MCFLFASKRVFNSFLGLVFLRSSHIFVELSLGGVFVLSLSELIFVGFFVASLSKLIFVGDLNRDGGSDVQIIEHSR